MATALMTVASVIIRLFLSAILLGAAWHKLRDHRKFQAELEAYQLLPNSLLSFSLLPLASAALALTEIFTALYLLNPTQWVPALLAASLLGTYAMAMAINLLRGRQHIGCGCSGPSGRTQTIAWSLVLRNLVLVLLALFCVAAPANAGDMNTAQLLIALAGTMVALLLYAAMEQAISNTQGYAQWTH